MPTMKPGNDGRFVPVLFFYCEIPVSGFLLLLMRDGL